MGMYVCVVFSLSCAVHVHLCISTSLLPIFDKVPSYQAIEITDWRERERKGKGGERERERERNGLFLFTAMALPD